MRPRVMVVDDDESIRIMLETILEHDGHDVVCAAGGAEALERLRAEPPPDLVVLDVMMPGMCGWDVIEAMHESPRLAGIPVVVLTAFDGAGAPPRGRPMLHKPVDDDVLRAVIRELLAQK